MIDILLGALIMGAFYLGIVLGELHYKLDAKRSGFEIEAGV